MRASPVVPRECSVRCRRSHRPECLYTIAEGVHTNLEHFQHFRREPAPERPTVDPTPHILRFRSRNPKAGESSVYEIHSEGQGVVGYLDIALLPNLIGAGTVLLIQRLFSEMDGAAANPILAKELLPAVTHALESQSEKSNTEILLEVRDLDASQSESKIVSIPTGLP